MLKAPSPASGTGYGDNDLAINGDYAFVGASGDGTGGEVFVYKRSGTSWNHHQTLVSSDISSSDDFGEGLDLSGNYLVVGAPGENSNYGALYIFKNIGGTWTQQQKLVSTVSGNMGRNARLSIDGDYIVTGGHQDGSDGLSNSGAVYIFKKDEGVEAWTQQATLRAPTPIANGYFGSKTRIKGKTVIVGQPNDGDNGTNAGAVYIYQRSGTTWSFIKKFYSSDIDTGDQFGTSVSISENDVFVSAMYEDSQGSNAGKGYIYPLKEVTNYYITQPGTYRADLQICGIDYKTNEVEVTGTPSDIGVSTELTFDGYNQLSLTNTPTYRSSKLTYGSNVYDIGTLTSDITIEKPGEYASLTFDTSSNVAYFSNVTVGAMGTTLADYVVDTTIYGTVQSGQTHQIGQGGFGNNTILNADGTRLLITDPLNYPSGRGRAYIYHLENGSWVLKQTWDNPNNTGQRFADGACMNEDGTRIFLMHNASEKVYTYEYTNGAWPTDNTGTHVITVGTNIGAEYEGLACNKAGDVLLMGHGNANTAYIYRRASATSWSQD